MRQGRGALVLGLVGVVSFVSGGWLLQRGSTQAGSVYQKARLFEDIVSHVADYYVDSVDERKLYDMAIDGMLEQLNDPYTAFLREKEYRDLTLNTTGNYAGLGIQIGVRDGWVTVIAPLPDTPAEKAGMIGGDRILEVDEQSAYGWKEEKAVQMLRGQAGTQVKVRVARPGVSDSLIFNITRARIHVRSVEFSSMLTPAIGYVQLRTVAESSPAEMRDGINALRKQGAKALVLDLRDNPGGLLESGVELTDLFLDRDQLVVETKGRSPGASKSYSADDPQVWPDMPVVVLVDGNTASASEIISGALQDHDRALIVGTPTFGKGLVQTLFQLSATEALKITTAKWYTPSGRLIQRAGTGDVVVADTDAKKDSATTTVYMTDAGRVLPGGGGIHPDVIAGSDSLGTAEREFAKALGSKIPAYRDAMTAYALELKVQGAVKDESFLPTPAMRAELLRRIRAKGVTVPDSVWSGVQKFIDQQFSYEAVHYSFSKAAEWKRRSADDVQVQKAVQLLQRARTPRELIALAANTKSGATPARP